MPGCDRLSHTHSSHRSEDSTRRRDVGGIDSFSKPNCKNRYFDYDKLASAVLSGIPSPRKTSQTRDCPGKRHPNIL